MNLRMEKRLVSQILGLWGFFLTIQTVRFLFTLISLGVGFGTALFFLGGLW